MARVDYEGAWNELAELICTKEGQGWGTETLLAEMQKIAIRHQIPEDFLQKAARLFGALPSIQTHVSAETAPTEEAAAPLDGKPDPEPSKSQEARDERHTRSTPSADRPPAAAAV